MLVFYSNVHMLTVTLGLAESIELIKHACSALYPMEDNLLGAVN
jgi:hypothetical protein